MRGRCAWACQSAPVTFDLGAMTLTLETLKKSCATWCVQSIGATLISLGMWTTHEGRCAWACHSAPVTFDLGAMTLTLEIVIPHL